MNLECRVCTGNKIATSFNSLDDLQAHLFMNHHDGPLDVFQFVCHKCEFKFGTEYRLLRHEEICGRESRSEEDMEKIRYKLQMYELLELTLKYNMTKHQISGARPANQSNIGTLETRETQCQTESLGSKEIKSEIPESLENPVSNSRRENNEKNGSGPSVITNESTKNFDENCSHTSATNTQSNVKTEPEDVDPSEVEVLGTVEIRKRKAPSKPAEHISHRSGENAQQNVNSEGESNMPKKQAKTNLLSEETLRNPSETHQDEKGTWNAQSRTVDGIPLWKQFILGSTNADAKQIPHFKSARDQEERITLTSTATNWSPTTAKLTNRIDVNGPCLHPQRVNPESWQREEFRAYFGQFGKISIVTVRKNTYSTVTFENCESVAKCIQQRTHKILGRDFVIWETTPSESMKWKLVATRNQNTPQSSSENATNRILVTGPLLHPEENPEQVDPKVFQKEMFRTYFGQFGKVISVWYSLLKLQATIAFDNCDSAAKCIQQRNHTICGRNFVVRKETPTRCMRGKIRANLHQNMSGPSSENVSVDSNWLL
ncbi:heterogeneous nuclear ribonucleoprotein A3 like protein 2 isoform X1 [Ditylenchus destructor]|nr:heterogeneous nuclear ribonucleoprotein A3 like protein 2 isoform X1 [Ditylenchus destructor]